jgi:hypothetical protein
VSASRFTADVRSTLVDRTAAGLPLTDACREAGVREATAKGWLTRGRREDAGEYAEFVIALDRARAEADARPGPMGEDELARVVSKMARAGSVQAAKLRWEMLGAARDTAPEQAADEFDELKERRRGRAA